MRQKNLRGFTLKHVIASEDLSEILVRTNRGRNFSLRREDACSRVHRFLEPRGGYNDYTVVVADQPVSGVYDYAATLNRDLHVAGILRASRVRDYSTGEHWETATAYLGAVANCTVNHDACQPLA